MNRDTRTDLVYRRLMEVIRQTEVIFGMPYDEVEVWITTITEARDELRNE